MLLTRSRWRSSDADQRAIQAAEPVLGGCDQPIGGVDIRVVGDDPGHPIICGARREAGCGRSRGGFVRAAEKYAPALRGECRGRGEPEAATAAGDEVGPVSQTEIHAADRIRRVQPLGRLFDLEQ